MPDSAITVAALNLTPVKGLRIARQQRLRLDRAGVRGDRCFYIVDQGGRMVNGKVIGSLQQVRAELEEGLLTLAFPDGSRVSATVEEGETIETSFFSTPRPARVLRGPLSDALSAHTGRPLRIVAPADGSSAVDRGWRDAGVSLISRASLQRLAQEAGVEAVDPRRFRMSIEVDGAAPFAEDGWIDREISIGEVRVVFRGHVGRCLVTRRDPETGELDLETLDLLASIRDGAETTEPLALGIYGAIVEPGVVSVGDPVLSRTR
jgi:uncharacterized protein YcbX